jgi:tol-pal system protein YbgF
MRRMGVSCAVAAALLVGSSTAAFAANKEQQQLMAELRMLQQHQQQLQQMVQSLGENLKTVTTRMDEQAATARKALADQRLLVEGVTESVRVLREKADDTNVRLSSFTQELEAMRQTIAALPQPAAVTAPTGDPSADPSSPNPAAPSGTAPPITVPPPNVSPQRTYDAAYSDYTGGQYEVAILGFETFLKMFPRDPRADDAQLNIGNSLYNAGKFREAVTAYQRVISEHPKTESVPQAYYKMGLSYHALKEPALARKAFEMVVQNYPNDPLATLARQNIDRLPKQEP